MFINTNKTTNSTEETNETNLSSQNTVILQHDYARARILKVDIIKVQTSPLYNDG